jgi:hypothetical protein
VSLQAQARAHRIGQSRDVLVLRLLASSTIEEHILHVAEQKRKFADSSITGTLAGRRSHHCDDLVVERARTSEFVRVIASACLLSCCVAAAGMACRRWLL